MAGSDRALRAELVSAGHMAPSPGWHMRAHSHPFHELILAQGGAMTVEHEGRRTTVTAGEVVLYPAGMVHAERADPGHPLESHFLAFRGGGIAGRRLMKVADLRGRMRQMARWIYSDVPASSAAVRVGRNALLNAILAEFVRGEGAEDRPLVSAIRRHVREHIGEPLSLADLAAVAGMSRYHFIRAYRNATGRTPMQDVRAIRADHARALILGTHLPLKEVAPRAGLGNEYSMSRLFKRVFKMPPGQYRRMESGRIRRAKTPAAE